MDVCRRQRQRTKHQTGDYPKALTVAPMCRSAAQQGNAEEVEPPLIAGHLFKKADGTWNVASAPANTPSRKRQAINKDSSKCSRNLPEDPITEMPMFEDATRHKKRKISARMLLVDDGTADAIGATIMNEGLPTLNYDTPSESKSCSRKRKLEGDNFSIGDGHSSIPVDLAEGTIPSSPLFKIKALGKRRTASARKKVHTSDDRNVQQNLPAPYGPPPVWSDRRQGLCETLPYYRAYQSGAYMNDGLVYGFLCDKEVGPTDRFTDEVMIARV